MGRPKKPTPPQVHLTRRDALEELARRKGHLASPGNFRLEDYLFDKQLLFVKDPAPFKVGVTTRRAGKSISCVADLTFTALETPGVVVLYITLSRKNAKRLVWPEFKKINARFSLGGEANESDLSITYPNGSILYLLGASDRTSIEDIRGLPVKKAYLDEGQSFPPYIEELVDDVLGPALMDHAGQLVVIGTPGPIPSGYFYDLTKNSAWAHHTWSFFDNPRLPFLLRGLTHQDMLMRELNRRGVSMVDPSIQREWFGRWVIDENSLVYKYHADRNHFDSLPDGDWTYIMGIDLGFNDADALAVLAYSDKSPNTYLLAESIEPQQDITTLAGKIEELKLRYPISKFVVDAGGLGKKIAEEITKRFQIPLIAAEKHRKFEYIELMNDALRTGRLRIKSSSRFAHDASKVEWDHLRSTPDKRVISDRFHSDICEAVLYAWRESYSYTYQAPEVLPEFGTEQWSRAEADKMFQAELAKYEAAREEAGEAPEIEIDNTGLQSLDRPTLRYQARFDKRRPR